MPEQSVSIRPLRWHRQQNRLGPTGHYLANGGWMIKSAGLRGTTNFAWELYRYRQEPGPEWFFVRSFPLIAAAKLYVEANR